MADWSKIPERGNVQDRRSIRSPLAVGGGIGLLLVMGITYLLGGNPLDVLVNSDLSQLTSEDTSQFEGEDSYETFVSAVLGSNNEYWSEQLGERYIEPTLVLFRSSTQSACGGAKSVVGPHYCPADNTIYIDETFFELLQSELGAQGGDVAEAYVISHEVGHHVQNLLGKLEQAFGSQQGVIQTELTADCYAGLWASSLKGEGILLENEINEAIDAAAAVGDDRIQQETTGYVQPESWTHGSSQQRVDAFKAGYDSGSIEICAF